MGIVINFVQILGCSTGLSNFAMKSSLQIMKKVLLCIQELTQKFLNQIFKIHFLNL